MKLGFIGAGNMAKAIIGGICAKGVVAADDMIVASPVPSERDYITDTFSIKSTASNVEAVSESDMIIIAVKPGVVPKVVDEIKDAITLDKFIISIAAGKTIGWYEEAFGKKIKLIRTMPNTPALVGEGMTGVSPNSEVTEAEIDAAMKILSAFGKAEIVPESIMDAVVSVSGSSPAYVFILIEAMADGAVKLGMPRDKAYTFAAQSVLGSAKMVLESGKHPAALKDMVCSPAGTTIAAVQVLEEAGFRGSIIDAMEACAEVSRSL